MSKKNPVMPSIYELIQEITGKDEIFLDRSACSQLLTDSDSDLLGLIVTEGFVVGLDAAFRQKLTGRTLKELFSATSKGNKSSMVGDREDLAKKMCIDSDFGFRQVSKAIADFEAIFGDNNRHPNFSLEKMPGVYGLLLEKPIRPIKWLTNNSQARIVKEFEELDRQLDLVRKGILYLYHQKRYADFFWWLFMFSLLQCEIVRFLPYLPVNQYRSIIDYLGLKDKDLLKIRRKPFVSVHEDDFWDIRRKLIDTATGHLIIMGPSLKEAFDRGHKNNVWTELQRIVSIGQVKNVSILLTDPIIFNSDYVCSDPKDDVNRTIKSLQENFYALFNDKRVDLSIYFLPLLQIDHAVITEEFMAFRSNKLWNCERKFKGAFTLHVADFYTSEASEYSAQMDYIRVIMSNSTVIYPDVDVDDAIRDQEDARTYHKTWREYLRNKRYNHIYLYKVYEKQIHSYVCNTWRKSGESVGVFSPGGSISSIEGVYDPGNLLDDPTQNALLPYLKETEDMFTEAIKKHDRNEGSYCHLYPSLDLGFPNNVRRLAGGFATGMLVTWNCGTEIVPIDATVNVCTSSVFKLDQIDPSWLSDRQNFFNAVEGFALEAAVQKGYSFSFCSGNHFLTISQDKKSGEYYLVLHSSANELKHSYMGLYPVEDNWYSQSIKHIKGKDGRYFRYLKDEDARYFIRMAKNFQKYNEQIHQWVAERINGGEFRNDEKWIAHHYYMPTDQSIAIGTFAEPVGAQVPMFSAHGKSVYIFEIGPDNFQVDLGGQKGKVCIIPHGWGQKIDGIEKIEIRNGNLVLTVDGVAYPTRISSQEHIRCESKRIRDFEDGEDFLATGNGYIQGKFIKELIPCVEYSRNTVGNRK